MHVLQKVSTVSMRLNANFLSLLTNALDKSAAANNPAAIIKFTSSAAASTLAHRPPHSLLTKHRTLFTRKLGCQSQGFHKSLTPFGCSKKSFSTIAKPEPIPIQKIRNVAIIAHVDHGKTTLVDSLLQQSGVKVSNTRLLDQGELEKEKGITILAKATRVTHKDHIINIVDTPGHADFGGEVERVLSIVDGVVLVVDYATGPMSQSRFVLSKALLNPKGVTIVVANKLDRSGDKRSPGAFENEVFELFVSMGVNDDQLEYSTLYGSAKQGWMEKSFEECNKEEHSEGVGPLLDAIISEVPPPTAYTHESLPVEEKPSYQFLKDPITPDFTFLVTIVEHVPEIGYCLTGKVHSGIAMKNSGIYIINPKAKSPVKARIREIYVTQGVNKVKVPVASTGDIVTLELQGGQTPAVHDTLAATATAECLPCREIDPPVLAVDVGPNTSPLQGQDGKYCTFNDLTVRLKRESLVNVSIHVHHNPSGKAITVHGRGDLQISVLLEAMRREGYEFEISPPQVLFKKDEDGKPLEPYEKVTIVVPNACGAKLLEHMALRGAEFLETHIDGDFSQFVFECSTRLFFGVHLFVNDLSRGLGQVTTELIGYRRATGTGKTLNRKKQVIAMAPGTATVFDMLRFQNDCRYFVEACDPVYEGMILGQTSKQDDFYVNICRGRKLVVVTVRAKDDFVALQASIKTPIEFCLAYIQDGEIIEVTPKRIAMRKQILNNDERIKTLKKQIKVAA